MALAGPCTAGQTAHPRRRSRPGQIAADARPVRPPEYGPALAALQASFTVRGSSDLPAAVTAALMPHALQRTIQAPHSGAGYGNLTSQAVLPSEQSRSM